MSKLFPINIEVEPQALGNVLLALNGFPGVVKLNLNLKGGEITEAEQNIAPLQKNLTPPTGMNTKQVVANALKNGPMHRILLGKVLDRAGYSAASLASMITKMRANGEIRVTAPGTYRLTERGFAISRNNGGFVHPRQMTRRGGARYAGRADNQSGVRGLVLDLLANAPSGAQTSMIIQVLGANNYSPKNMSGAVQKMRQEGLIDKNDDHVWTLTAKGAYARGRGETFPLVVREQTEQEQTENS